jgi:hypothetical protein
MKLKKTKKMKSKIFKPTLLALFALFAICIATFAQVPPPAAPKPPSAKHKTFKFDDKAFEMNMEDLGKDFKFDFNFQGLAAQLNDIAPKIALQFKDFDKKFNFKFDNIAPEINMDLGNMGKNFNFNFDNIAPEFNFDFKDLGDFNFKQDDKSLEKAIQSGEVKEKIKNYTKSYPLDGNDKIKLSDQYGKITITTWDKHEIKVDVQIKADAESDDEAQKLLDKVQINDSKIGDIVSFKTEVTRTNGIFNSWSWNGKKVHKIEINYTVYMPAKQELTVENSYGAIELPDLSGKLKINASYSTVTAQNLTNTANEIEGSYSKFKITSLNNAHISCGYSPVEIEQCNNLNANLSYGPLKLGGLTGNAELDLSYSSLRIGEISNLVKKLNINSTYSGVTLGVVGSDNFDFDITASYGGFNYSKDGKVVITNKSPEDGRHYSTTRVFKGYYGKAGSDAKVVIHSTYGGVNFK